MSFGVIVLRAPQIRELDQIVDIFRFRRGEFLPGGDGFIDAVGLQQIVAIFVAHLSAIGDRQQALPRIGGLAEIATVFVEFGENLDGIRIGIFTGYRLEKRDGAGEIAAARIQLARPVSASSSPESSAMTAL